MHKNLLSLQRSFFTVLTVALLFTADVVHAAWWNSWVTSSDMTINGRRTITRSNDGVKRSLEGDNPIEIQDGKITGWKEGTVLTLEQTGGPQQRQAELRGTASEPALWIKDDKGFHSAGLEDQKWLQGFLAALFKKPDADKPAAASPATSDDSGHLNPVGTWSWFNGKNITFKDDHTVAGPANSGTWSWSNEDERELKIEWKDPVREDTLNLSEDGRHLQGHNDAPMEVYGDRYLGDAAPATQTAGAAAFSGTDPDSPLGTWHWFVGRDETFHPDGTVTYPQNYATWKWVDQSKRTLVVEWKTLPFVDKLTLSKDGQQLEGENNAPAKYTPNTVTAQRVISPLGVWRMNKGANVTFRENHAAAFDDEDAGFWYWLDESKRQLRVEWSTIPFVDTLTLSEDGNTLQGTNHKADIITGHRLAGPLPVPPVETDPDSN